SFHCLPDIFRAPTYSTDSVDAVTRRSGGQIEVKGNRRWAVVSNARGHEPDGARSLGDECSCRWRWTVAQLDYGLLHAFFGSRPHVWQAVQYAGYRLMRHACKPRDV